MTDGDVTHDDPRLEPDPRFPDRPHTLDFARLSGAVNHMDAVSDMLGIEAVLGVDPDSLLYIGGARINAVLTACQGRLTHTELVGIYFDAFQLGVEYQKRGGHRPEETGAAGEKEGSL